MNYEFLLEYCQSDTQRETIQACIECGSNNKAAKKLGKGRRVVDKTVKRVKAFAAKQGYSPDHDMNNPVPDGYYVNGVSTLYDEDGNKKIQWVKSSASKEKTLELIHQIVDTLKEDIPQAHPISYSGHADTDLMAVYPLGDPHIGMLSWEPETGQSWDINIAKEKFINVFDRLVKTAPKCKTAVIVNLGDFFHADNTEGKTSRSGNSLDLDGRFDKMADAGYFIMRQMIDSALEHHEKVKVIIAGGNHDDVGSIFFRRSLEHIYANVKRVEIDTSPEMFHYIKHGKVFIGIHHGHSCKMQKLPLIMATDKPTEWGQTQFRYWYTGHIHNDKAIDDGGAKVESFRTISAPDAYAHGAGYRSGQDSKCLVLHKDFGEVERHTVNLSMV